MVQRPGRAATSRFSRTVSDGKDLALLRHVAEPGPGAAIGGEASDLLTVQAQMPAVQRSVAHDGRHQGGLADAVAADDRDRLAILERKPDLFEHDGLAVAGGDLLELEREGLAHGRASRCA